MRKITFGGANSLDNFIARTDNRVDWLMWSDEVKEIIGDYWKTIDTVLMGRKTFDAGRDQYSGGGNPAIKTYVFSRKMKPGPQAGVEIVSGDAVSFVKRLKAEEGRDICLMGGGDFAKTLFEADLVDEVGFNIHPVLLGNGIPLFLQMRAQIDLDLIECRPLKNGCVYLTYRVKH